MTPQQRGGFAAPLLPKPELGIDRAAELATGAVGGSTLAAIFAPTQQSQAWRVQVRATQSENLTTVMVDDRSGTASPVTLLSGDRTALWIRWLHEGSHSGVLWQTVVFICGILPTLFLVTGVLIWLRRRRLAPAAQGMAAVPQVEAAE